MPNNLLQSVKKRRIPVQTRSQHTVDIILETCKLVLAEGGEDRLTTNRIAERAGISIGTLYQYFDSRDAIFKEVLARQRLTMMRALEGIWKDQKSYVASPQRALQVFVRQYIEAFSPADPQLGTLVALALRIEPPDVTLNSLREAGEKITAYLYKIENPHVCSVTPILTFLLTRTLASVVRAAAIERFPFMRDETFCDSIVRMLWSIIEPINDELTCDPCFFREGLNNSPQHQVATA